MLGVSLGIAAWGLVTGVAMVKAGLGVPLSLAMSLIVYAGSAQLAALPLIAAGSPIWVVWLTALCVNLRFVIFSAQWRSYFSHLTRAQRWRIAYFAADLNFVLFLRRFPRPTQAPEVLPYYWGGVVTNWCAWQTASILGIVLADQIPVAWGLGFAGTLALVGLMCSLVQGPSTWVSGVVAGTAAVAAFALPFKLNLVVAIAAALAAGAVIDHLAKVQRGAAP